MNFHQLPLIALTVLLSAGLSLSACDDTGSEPTADAASVLDAASDAAAPSPDEGRPQDSGSMPDAAPTADTGEPSSPDTAQPPPDVADDSSIPETTAAPDGTENDTQPPSDPDSGAETGDSGGQSGPDATIDDNGGPAAIPGETCQDAPSLLALSGPPSDQPPYYRTATGVFGSSDDYNPLETSGLPPACALVYDAYGPEVVVTLALAPGETLEVSYGITPTSQPGGIYLLDSCDSPGWPDIDGGGKCGNNEYASQGFCSLGSCDDLEFSFTWPLEIDGEPTSEQTFWLVLDQVAGAAGTDWSLDWVIKPAP